MRDGFIKVAAGTPKIRVADCRYNAEQIFTMMREADKQGVKVLCLPELCLTGYTCGDLFLQDTLLCGAEEGLQTILEATRNLDMVTVLGLPVRCKWDNKLYNCAAVIQSGEILGLVPKTYLPNYGEFYEERWFASGAGVETSVDLCGETVDMDAAGLFACETVPNLVLGVEICEDLWGHRAPLRPAGPGRGYGDPETCRPPTSWWASLDTAAIWWWGSQGAWCADMCTPMLGKESPPPTWCSPATT